MQFLYGNHVLKNGLGRITENTPAYTGVVVYSMSGGCRSGVLGGKAEWGASPDNTPAYTGVAVYSM